MSIAEGKGGHQRIVSSCFTRLREAGLALKAIQAQAGHRSTCSTTESSAGTGKPLARTSIKEQLIDLGCFLDRSTTWGCPDAPTRPLLFVGDLPRIDRPLPRFLDDPAAAKLAAPPRRDRLARPALRRDPRPAPASVEDLLDGRNDRPSGLRMLGNGYCARPVEMDCQFEFICESCTFFVTTTEFEPTLRKRRDDAADKGQVGRQEIFDGLLNRLDEEAS